MNDKILKRLADLNIEVDAISRTKNEQYYEGKIWDTTIDTSMYHEWSFKFLNLITLLNNSQSHYKDTYESIQKDNISTYEKFNAHTSLFLAFKDDYENGYKVASAVISGVVLETSIRSICKKENIELGKLDKMNSELAKAGIYNKLQQKRITALADIRNSAAHGKINEFSDNDVKIMIRDIESFILTFLS